MCSECKVLFQAAVCVEVGGQVRKTSQYFLVPLCISSKTSIALAAKTLLAVESGGSEAILFPTRPVLCAMHLSMHQTIPCTVLNQKENGKIQLF